MEKGRRDTVLLTVIGIATLLVAIVGATFAYFTARLTNSDTNSTLIIRSAQGSTVVFVGNGNFTATNIYPRDEAWLVKPFRVEYTAQNSGYTYTYHLQLHYTNSFASGEIAYRIINEDGYCSNTAYGSSATCESPATWTSTGAENGTRASLNTSGTFAKTTTEAVIDLGNGTFVSGTTAEKHPYVLEISYPNDTTRNQNYGNGSTDTSTLNQGASLTAWISIEEVVNSGNLTTTNNG